MTTADSHSSSDTLTENNLVIFYSRLHQPIVLNDDELIPQEVLQMQIEVCEEHIEGIIKAVAYNLIIKLDNDRAVPYKLDYTELYEQYKEDIEVNYYRGRSGTNVSNPSTLNESGLPYGTNWRY